MGNPTSEKRSKVLLGVQGRLVIPAGMRRLLGLSSGDTLVARVEDDHLVIEKGKTMKHRLKERSRRMPQAVDIVAELTGEGRRKTLEEGEA